MPTTAITVQTAPTVHSQTGATLSQTAGDVANGNHIAATSGKLIVLAHNTGTQSYTASITSVADSVYGRTGNAVATVASNVIHMFHIVSDGWKNTNDQIVMAAGHASVKFSIVKV